jgi:ribosomal protein L12E/L44/L45/RPP1/RPP2
MYNGKLIDDLLAAVEQAEDSATPAGSGNLASLGAEGSSENRERQKEGSSESE